LNSGIETIETLEDPDYEININYGGFKVDQDMNIFASNNTNTGKIIKFNKTDNTITLYGEESNNKNSGLGVFILIAISPIEGAVYCLNNVGIVKRIAGVTKKEGRNIIN